MSKLIDVLPTEMAGFCTETSERAFVVADCDGESATVSILIPVNVHSWPEIAKSVESCLAAMYKTELPTPMNWRQNGIENRVPANQVAKSIVKSANELLVDFLYHPVGEIK